MLANDTVVLQRLTTDDADRFYELYKHRAVTLQFDEQVFLPDETPVRFTERIIALCEYIFTIRLKEAPQLIIGDCALHHCSRESREIEIGGSLFPEYWGKGIMRAAFDLIIDLAREQLGATAIIGRTKIHNEKAIRLVEKMGFARHQIDRGDIVMRKKLCREEQ